MFIDYEENFKEIQKIRKKHLSYIQHATLTCLFQQNAGPVSSKDSLSDQRPMGSTEKEGERDGERRRARKEFPLL